MRILLAVLVACRVEWLLLQYVIQRNFGQRSRKALWEHAAFAVVPQHHPTNVDEIGGWHGQRL